MALFTPGAIGAIACASAGVPRNVNTICFNSLTLAYALDKHQVGTEEVAEALRDLALPTAASEGAVTEPRPGYPLGVGSVLAYRVTTASPQSALVVDPVFVGQALPPVNPAPFLQGPLAFVQTAQSFRPAWLAGAAALLAVCAFFLGKFLLLEHI